MHAAFDVAWTDGRRKQPHLHLDHDARLEWTPDTLHSTRPRNLTVALTEFCLLAHTPDDRHLNIAGAFSILDARRMQSVEREGWGKKRGAAAVAPDWRNLTPPPLARREEAL